MATQSIAIIGATGNMGSAIARSLVKSKYRLLLMAGNKEKLATLTGDLKTANPLSQTEIIDCAKEACWEADIIIPAVPYAAEKEMAEKIKEVATGKIVISISNPLNPAYDGLLTAADTSAAEELQKLLPYSNIIKALNTTFAAGFAQPVIDGTTVDCFIAGDDVESVKTVELLVRSIGFNPLVAGNLIKSRTLENMTLLLIQLNNRYGYNRRAGWKVLHNKK